MKLLWLDTIWPFVSCWKTVFKKSSPGQAGLDSGPVGNDESFEGIVQYTSYETYMNQSLNVNTTAIVFSAEGVILSGLLKLAKYSKHTFNSYYKKKKHSIESIFFREIDKFGESITEIDVNFHM